MFIAQMVFACFFIILWWLKVSRWFNYPLIGFLVCWPFLAMYFILAVGDWQLPMIQILHFVISHIVELLPIWLLSTMFALLIGALSGITFWCIAKVSGNPGTQYLINRQKADERNQPLKKAQTTITRV